MLRPRPPQKILVDVHSQSHAESHEHRAPTDDSLRLLREMEQVAFDRLISTMTINASGFEAAVFSYTDHLNSPFTVKVRVKFTLGEVEHDHTFDVEHAAVRSQDELIKAAHRKLAEEIATSLLGQLMAGQNRFHLFPRA